MRCSNCGAEIMNGAQFCTSCGTPQNQPQQQYAAPNQQPNVVNPQQFGNGYQQVNPGFVNNQNMGFVDNNVSMQDAEMWLKVLSLLIPIVGIIMYFVKKNNEPIAAKSCLTWGLIGFGISLILSIFA